MTIDERLEKLAERHEALTANVELMQREFEKRHAWVLDTLVRIEGQRLENELQISKLTARVDSVAQTVDRLAATVERYIAGRGNGSNRH
ncbi:MAG TPA: hypothetical protein VMT20_20935 [Terriglobia bacterium]|nr:hypothetical protein [Terriglobia bacterium]